MPPDTKISRVTWAERRGQNPQRRSLPRQPPRQPEPWGHLLPAPRLAQLMQQVFAESWLHSCLGLCSPTLEPRPLASPPFLLRG